LRLGSLWKHEKEENGEKKISISGEISSDLGVNLQAGSKLFCRLVKNEKYVAGGKFPLYFIEAWVPRDLPVQGQDEPGPPPGVDDDIPF